MFGRSQATYDEEVVLCKEGSIGFWADYAIALSQKQFWKTVDEMLTEFRETYPEKVIPRRELHARLADALSADGWRPVKKPITDEIARLKRKKRSEIRALRGGRTKREWDTHLAQRR